MDIHWGFIIKKIIATGLKPLSLGLILVLLALWSLHKGRPNKAKKYLFISIIWILLISYAPFVSLLISPLEKAYPRLEAIPHNIEYILLLGGDRKRRTWEALRLYQEIPSVKIITSGGSAEKTIIMLEESGVKKEDILIQGKAKDTHEEAQYLKDRIGNNNPFILVTGAYHMPRAMQLFKQQGLKPIAAPADFNDTEPHYFTILDADELDKTTKAFHEYIGLLWIKLRKIIKPSHKKTIEETVYN